MTRANTGQKRKRFPFWTVRLPTKEMRMPQEKPRVDGRVRVLQEHWATPVPKAQNLADIKTHLPVGCLGELERTQQGQPPALIPQAILS